MKTLKSGASRGRECLSRTPQRNKSEVIIRGEEKKQVMGRPTSLPTPSGWYVEPKAFSIPLSPLTIVSTLCSRTADRDTDNLMDNHTTLVMRTIQLRYRDIGSKQE
ncbi:hypothetical protein SFRURICE_021559 [Spodoptera frugiperda]|nr:hypothetical protein SFRURICE_021559 [Spodoptera frugiperda]